MGDNLADLAALWEGVIATLGCTCCHRLDVEREATRCARCELHRVLHLMMPSLWLEGELLHVCCTDCLASRHLTEEEQRERATDATAGRAPVGGRAQPRAAAAANGKTRSGAGPARADDHQGVGGRETEEA